jgi:hypothetical protein
VEYGSTFCERCGLDSDRLGSAGASDFRVCPDCSSSTCANCWNQVAGRCLACSPFDLASAPRRASRRIVPAGVRSQAPAGVRPQAVGATPPRPAANLGVSSRTSVVARAVAAGDGVAAGGGRLVRRGLGNAARIAFVAVIVLAAFVGVRAVTVDGGAVAHPGTVGVEVLVPANPAASDAVTAAPEASAPAAEQDPSEPPAERHTRSGTAPSSNGGGSSGGGNGAGGGNGVGGNGGGGSTPRPPGTPIPTPNPNPTATPVPTPDPGSPTPDPETPTPDPGTPTPDPGTPTPDPGTPTPDPDAPTPDPGTPTPDPGTAIPDP